MNKSQTKQAMLAIARLWLKILDYEIEGVVQCRKEAVRKTKDKAPWDDSKHPRRSNGQFGHGGTESAILEEEFVVPNTLSAMAKTFYVKTGKPLRDEGWRLKAGTAVTGVKAIAVGEKIRDLPRLMETYKKPNGADTSPGDWIKARGTATVENNGETCKAEVHWYQCKDIGKVEFKAKRWYR